jgi:hypothetical protein
MAWRRHIHEVERLRVNRSVLVYDFMRERRPEVRSLVGHRVPFAFGGELDLVRGSPVLQRVHLAQLRYEGEQRVVADAGGVGR